MILQPIHTPRLLLRTWRGGDEAVLRRLLGDPQVRAHLGGPVVEPERSRRVRTEVRGRVGSYAIEWAGAVVGWARVDREGTEAELSWVLLPEHVGHGVATEAGRALLDWCGTQPGIERVTAMAQEGNARSHRVAARIGLSPVATVDRFGAWQVVHAGAPRSERPIPERRLRAPAPARPAPPAPRGRSGRPG